MKLSQLSTDKAADMLCELTPYIANITGDKSLLDELAHKFDSKGKSVAELYVFAAKRYTALVPILPKTHKADVFGVLAVLNETTPEAVGKQNVLSTMRQIREAFKDKELLDFFKSWQEPEEIA